MHTKMAVNGMNTHALLQHQKEIWHVWCLHISKDAHGILTLVTAPLQSIVSNALHMLWITIAQLIQKNAQRLPRQLNPSCVCNCLVHSKQEVNIISKHKGSILHTYCFNAL